MREGKPATERELQDFALARWKQEGFDSEGGHPGIAVDAHSADPHYSAAWKLLGRALAEGGDAGGAIAAFERGIAVARERGDEQAAKEMGVFLRRLHKPAAP